MTPEHLALCQAAVEAFPARVAAMRDTRPDTELRRLWMAAAEAREAVSAGYRDGLGERVMDLLEDTAFDAEHALRDHLLTEHRLTTADLNRSVL